MTLETDCAYSPSRFSFSSISDTTVDSSIIDHHLEIDNAVSTSNNYIIDKYLKDLKGDDLMKFDIIDKTQKGQTDSKGMQANPQNNYNIEGSKKIRVGDTIVNIFNKPASEGQVSTIRNQRKPIIEPSRIYKTFKKLSKNHVIVFTSIALMAVVTALLVLLLVARKHPQDNESTTISDIATTTDDSTLSTTTISNQFMIPRSEWTSDPISSSIKHLSTFPIRRIIVGQTDDSDSCYSKSECISHIRRLKSKDPNLLDIAWNFLIGGDGNIYEGRGYQHEGEHTSSNASNFNDIGIGIGFIGNYTSTPGIMMMDIFNYFISQSIGDGKISEDFKLFLQDQLIYKEYEAIGLANALKKVNNFHYVQKIHNRQDWSALNSTSEISKIARLNRVIIHHTGTQWICHDKQNCTETLRVLQQNEINLYGYSDIKYNFIIGGSEDFSIVMEGRGFSNIGAHTSGNNSNAIGIALIGNFELYSPGSAMMDALKNFIDDSVALGKLNENYLLHVKRDFDGSVSPGLNVINIVKEWKSFSRP